MLHSNWSFISHLQDWHYAGSDCSGIPEMKRKMEMKASPYCKNNITIKFGDWFKVGQFKLFCFMWGIWLSREDPAVWCLLFTYFSSWDSKCLVRHKTANHSLAYMRQFEIIISSQLSLLYVPFSAQSDQLPLNQRPAVFQICSFEWISN